MVDKFHNDEYALPVSLSGLVNINFYGVKNFQPWISERVHDGLNKSRSTGKVSGKTHTIRPG